MPQLDARGFFEVAGQQPERHVVARLQRRQQLANARHDVLDALPRQQDLFTQEFVMRIPHPPEQIVVQVVADFLQRVVHDDPVGTAGNRDAVEQIGQAEHGFAGAIHGADASAAGEHEGSIDIEKHEFGHGVRGIGSACDPVLHTGQYIV